MTESALPENMYSPSLCMDWWVILIWGILASLLGIMLITTPIETAYYLILFMGIYWFIGGIFTIFGLLQDRSYMGLKIFLSVISILAGVTIMAYPLYSTVLILPMLVIIIGVWGFIIGVTKLFDAFKSNNAGSGILGLISMVFGLILLVSPYAAAIALPIVAGFFSLFAGISTVFVAFQMKKGVGQVQPE